MCSNNNTFPTADFQLSKLIIPNPEAAALAGMEVASHSTTSGCSSYGSPNCSVLQRSISSQFLQKNICYHCHFSSPYHHDFLDMDTSPVRRVSSTGDLHHGHRAESPLSSESSMIIESMTKACKYSPEEKKERIERYRSKRNQRNFSKKIKYECRKTLADSRPRIRGRFARNDEIEKNPQLQWSNISGEEDEDNDDNWINFLDAFSANSIP